MAVSFLAPGCCRGPLRLCGRFVDLVELPFKFRRVDKPDAAELAGRQKPGLDVAVRGAAVDAEELGGLGEGEEPALFDGHESCLTQELTKYDDLRYSRLNAQPIGKRGEMAKANEEPSVRCYPGGLGDDFPNGPPTTVIEHKGIKLVLRFAAGDISGAGPVQEIRLLPDTLPLDTATLRLMPSAAMYFRYARAAMATLGSTEGTTKQRQERYRQSLEPFRKVAGPGRGHSPAFYQLLAQQYAAVLAEGETRPVTAIAEMHGVTISAASRWLKEARRRRLLEEKKATDAG